MTTHKTANTLTAPEAAYIAGLIDGEGTITLTRKHANENRQLALTVSSTERQLLEFLLARTGVGKITTKARYRPHHLQSFTYAVYNRQALQVLEQVEQYLLSYKVHRCRLILRDYLNVTPRNGKYSEAMLTRRRQFEEKVLSITCASEQGSSGRS